MPQCHWPAATCAQAVRAALSCTAKTQLHPEQTPQAVMLTWERKSSCSNNQPHLGDLWHDGRSRCWIAILHTRQQPEVWQVPALHQSKCFSRETHTRTGEQQEPAGLVPQHVQACCARHKSAYNRPQGSLKPARLWSAPAAPEHVVHYEEPLLLHGQEEGLHEGALGPALQNVHTPRSAPVQGQEHWHASGSGPQTRRRLTDSTQEAPAAPCWTACPSPAPLPRH